jgi:hypothetical protein
MNKLYFDDNLQILKKLYIDNPDGFIDLIYIDPLLIPREITILIIKVSIKIFQKYRNKLSSILGVIFLMKLN